MSTQKLLVAVIGLQSVILLGQWTGSSAFAPAAANAQERNSPGLLASGTRDLAMVEELKTLNGKMDKLMGLLESGKVQVTATVEPKK